MPFSKLLLCAVLCLVACGQASVPAASGCEDGLQNGTETGIDCGGGCEPCESAPSCEDGLQNGTETGIDCGGGCEPCESAPSCEDGVQNGTETGIDCGGGCEPCGSGVHCNAAFDCTLKCSTNECRAECAGQTRPGSRELLNAFTACAERQCPSTGGGVCDSSRAGYVQQNCTDCVVRSTDIGRPCEEEMFECLEDNE